MSRVFSFDCTLSLRTFSPSVSTRVRVSRGEPSGIDAARQQVLGRRMGRRGRGKGSRERTFAHEEWLIMHDDMWVYRSGIVHPTGEDITGYTVAATDGTIGKVDKHSADVSDAYLVVDTGPWIFGREVLIPAGTVTAVDEASRTVHVDRSKDQIKDAPEFHRDRHLSDPNYRLAMSEYYGITGTSQ